MSYPELHVRFPSVDFISQAEFEAYRSDAQSRLDARFRYEQGLASKAPEILRKGTCAACLRSACFSASTSGGAALGDGRMLPNWREQLVCDCEDQLNNRNRALLHFLAAQAGLHSWSRVLLFGPAAAVDRRIATMVSSVVSIPRLALSRTIQHGPKYHLPAADAAFHLAVSSEYLHRVPPLEAACRELRRVLAPGGCLVFTVPFHFDADRTVTRSERLPRVAGVLPTEAAGEVHELAWDLLDLLREAGFTDARAHMYWSNELGYLGTGNMLFIASA